MAHVKISNLNKYYGKTVHAVRNANIEIQKGEFIVLVGPSGCGKTTLLRMIAGLEEISSGEVFIGGRLVNDLPPAQRDIGMVFQDYALYPHMSVKENLSFGLKMRKTPSAEIADRVASASALLGLQSLLDRKPSQLSGGQRQRVAIGRALVKQPSVFLFDEPLSNLDAQLRAQTRIELSALHREIGSTSIYVTHDQVEAMTLASRIVVLKEGQIQQIGAPRELYHRPANCFVAAFIGTPGMNFLRGTITSGTSPGGREFTFNEGKISIREENAPEHSGEVILGVRPESAQVRDDGAVSAEVLQAEPHGHETHLIVRINAETTWVVRTGINSVPKGHVNLKVDDSALHWFDVKAPNPQIGKKIGP